MRSTKATKRFLAASLILATALPLYAFPPHRKHEARDQILALESQWRTAQVSDDTAAMEKLLAPDYLGIMWNGDVLTKTQQIDRMRTRQLVLTSYEATDVNVKIKGSVAIVTSLAHVQASSDNHPIDGDYRYTRVYQHLPGGTWQITNFEITRVHSMQDHRPAPPPPAAN